MILTEEEAKKKTCPFGTLNVLAMTSCGEQPASWPNACLCDASGCMMWRWGNGKQKLEVDALPISVLKISKRSENALLNKHERSTQQEYIDTIGKLRLEMETLKYRIRAEFGKKGQDEVRQALREFLADKQNQIRRGFCGLAGRVE